jgi:hypothetical protein
MFLFLVQYHDSFGQVYSLGRSSSFKSSGPNMYITFSSNDVVTATGFVILFSAGLCIAAFFDS